MNDRFQVSDSIFAENLWQDTGLKALLESGEVNGETLNEDEVKELWGGEILGLNSNIRVYRYSQGQFFDQHCTSISRLDLHTFLLIWLMRSLLLNKSFG